MPSKIVDTKVNRRPVEEETMIDLINLLAQNPELLEKVIQDQKNGNGQGK